MSKGKLDAKVTGVLRQVEWGGAWPRAISGQKYCPWCLGWKDEGHADGCKLDALLNKGEHEQEQAGSEVPNNQ